MWRIFSLRIVISYMAPLQVTFYYELPCNLQMEKEIRLNDEVTLVVEIAIFSCFLTLLVSVSLTYVRMQTEF